MISISEILTADHRHCDELFVAATQAADRGEWPVCRERFDAFHQSLRRHMDVEEQVVFPAFERATGMSGGPTHVMRLEHRRMLAELEQIAAAIVACSAAAFRVSAESFLGAMESHSVKEERVLYPMCDELLSGDVGEEVWKTLSAPVTGARASKTPA